MTWVPTTEMPADGLTKALPHQKHVDFIDQIGLIDIAERINRSNTVQVEPIG